MMEDHRLLISQDGSSSRSPPERCPRPPYSQDRPEEDVPENQQGDKLMDIKVEVKEEAEEPDIRAEPPNGSSSRSPPERCPSRPYSQDRPEEDVPENQQGDKLMDIKVEVKDEAAEPYIRADQQDGSSSRSLPERCPRPPYSQDRPEEDVAESQRDEDVTDIKVEVEEERMRGDHSWKSEVEEDVPAANPSETSAANFMLSINYKVEDEEIVPHSSGENVIIINVHPGLHSTNISYNPPNREEPFPDQSQITPVLSRTCGKLFHRDECEKQFTKCSSLYSQSEENLLCCSECGKCFTCKSGLSKHRRIHTGEKPYSCSECVKSFTFKSHLLTHERIHTGEKPYSCLECGKCFKDKSHLVIHERSHTGEKPFSCSECGKCFAKKSHLVRHERIHTGEKPFLCSECEKCFFTKSKLEEHQRIHTGEKPYSCSDCGKCFTGKSSLITHERIHSGQKPYSCSECGKCFTNNSQLVIHKRIHTGEKPYSCSECGKCFTNNSELVTHKRNHTGEKPYSCSECGKCFAKKSTLVEHQTIHPGEKAFSCSVCGKGFAYKSSFIIHQRIHTGEKPYSCSECGKCFTYRSSLAAHERSHTDERPYPCSVCRKYFRDKSGLAKHERRIHKREKLT